MIDSNYVKNSLSQDDIIKLCCALQGFDDYYFDSYGNPIFSTVLDHQDSSGSFKEYYFVESKTFYCFTRAASYDVFEMVRRARGLETFKEAFDFIVDFFHIKDIGFNEEEETDLTSDWDIFQKVKDYSVESNKTEEIKGIQENLLEYFYPSAAPTEWLKEGISAEVMRYYGIRVDAALHHIIIPHRDKNGRLIGIRRRSYDPIEVAAGKKYMPVFIQGKMYNHPLGQNLYGLDTGKETIKRMKKVCVFESEKSVMQISSCYGIQNNFAVATCGSNLSQTQIDLLLELGVEEVVLAYDRDFTGHKGDEDVKAYEQKLLKVVEPLLPYVNVSIIMDYDHLLPKEKMSPSDAGKDIFEKLYHSRIKLKSEGNKKEKSRRR